jgi:hypothetical protein
MEMRAQIVVDVILVSIAPAPSLLHHNDVGVTYPVISNLKMEPLRSIPLYFMAMPQFMVIVIEAPFVTTLVHIVVSMKSRPQTPRKTQLVGVHIEMPREVDRIFVGQPLDPGKGGSKPP